MQNNSNLNERNSAIIIIIIIIIGLVMLVSFSYYDNIICFFFFLFNLCKYLRIYGLKVVNINDCLTLILKVVRLIVTIISISISIL